MADPQQTTPIPSDNQQAVQQPSQETDFFGGGEEAFQNGQVVDPTKAVTPEPIEPTREPTLPNEKIEDGATVEAGHELKMENGEEDKQENTVDTTPSEEQVKPEEVAEEEQSQAQVADEPSEEQVVPPVTQEEKTPEVITGQSDLGKKFLELFNLVRKIYSLKGVEESFDIVGADNDKLHVIYKFFGGDEEYPLVSVTKIETEKEENEETIHELSFYLNEAGSALQINLDEELLFDEESDLQDDVKKRMQVAEKINKFIFLVGEEVKKLEKEMKEKEAEQEEKRKLQDVFRNF